MSQLLPITEGEAVGLLKALHWVVGSGLHHVVFELDSQRIVDLVLTPKDATFELDAVVSDCLNLISFFQNCSMSFVWRHANIMAHNLAKASSSLASLQDH
ncbi:replication protein A 70 kDa DNA-binding subunit [Trifolium pratense]|uniref:Replication protein A 70 kDa DNA-binding subunit n=1 Tax=Trifolium pratense TaxID=57577 RepID=A0A2K3NT03_TRIPR|nr:replication protein A 70 kDa DNA-binding subunit [Trifolium pratense]